MAFSSAAGVTTRPAAGGNVTLAAGFQPTAALLFGADAPSDGSWGTTQAISLGFWAASGDSFAAGLAVSAGTANTRNVAAGSASMPALLLSPTPATGGTNLAASAATVTSATASGSGLTLNWSAGPASSDLLWTAYGGDVAGHGALWTGALDAASSQLVFDGAAFLPEAAVLVARQSYTAVVFGGHYRRERLLIGFLSRRTGGWARWWDYGEDDITGEPALRAFTAGIGDGTPLPLYRHATGVPVWASGSLTLPLTQLPATGYQPFPDALVSTRIGCLLLGGVPFEAGSGFAPASGGATTSQLTVIGTTGAQVWAAGPRASGAAIHAQLGVQSGATTHSAAAYASVKAGTTVLRSRRRTGTALETPAATGWEDADDAGWATAIGANTATATFPRGTSLQTQWTSAAPNGTRLNWFLPVEPLAALPFEGLSTLTLEVEVDAKAGQSQVLYNRPVELRFRAIAALGANPSFVSTTAQVAFAASADQLRDAHEMATYFGVDVRRVIENHAYVEFVAGATLSRRDRLAGTAAAGFAVSGRLDRLDADGKMSYELGAAPALAVGLSGAMVAGAALTADPAELAVNARGAVMQWDWPYLYAASGDVIPATINLIRNPSLESDDVLLIDWSALAGATLTRVTNDGWHGHCSALVAWTASLGSGCKVVTQRSLVRKGGVLYASASHKALAGFGAFLVAVYADGTTSAAQPLELPFSTGWTRTVLLSLGLDESKELDYAEVRFERIESGSSGSGWIDAVQVEYGTVTPFAAGDYGDPYHAWTGTANLSPTVRQAVALQSGPAGRGGRVEISGECWITDALNRKVEDVTKHIISATVTCDADRDVSWSVNCKLTGEGYAKLKPWRDWLSFWLTVTGPDGVRRTGQIGHFFVLPSPRTYSETSTVAEIDGRSMEYPLKLQGFKGFLKIGKGAKFTAVVRKILNDLPVGKDRTENDVKARYELPDIDKKAKHDRSWEAKTPLLDIINECLDHAACLPLWVTNTGVLTTARSKDRAWDNRTPSRIWVANLDRAAEVPADARRSMAYVNEVIGDVKGSMDYGDTANEVVVTSSHPKSGKVKVTRRMDDPSYPGSTDRTGHTKRKKKNMHMPDVDTALELAEALAKELGTRYDVIEFTAVPDPSVQLVNEVVYLAIYNLAGEPVAVGRYRVLSVEYGFTPGDAVMKIRCGFVHPVNKKGDAVEPDTEIDYGAVQ